MSDKSGKTGLSSGSTWSLFAENTAFEESDAVVERLGNAAEATRLHFEDVTRFGSCPSRDSLYLTKCSECGKLLTLFSIQQHYESKHAKLFSMIKPPPPKRFLPKSSPQPPLTANNAKPLSSSSSFPKSKILKTIPNRKNFIRLEEMDPNEANVKIEEVPLTIPQFDSSKSKLKVSKLNLKKLVSDKGHAEKMQLSPCSPSQVSIQVKGVTKKIPPMKDKEFDPDKHCGVWIPEMNKNCTRSLTCKTHPLSMRRQVPGRSKEFDTLLAEHKARVALKQQDHNSAQNTISSPSQSRAGTPAHSPYGFEKIVFPTIIGPSPTNYCKDAAPSPRTRGDDSSNTHGGYIDYIHEDSLNLSSANFKQYHPRPIKVNNFGGRQTECHCRVFSRRMDHFKNAFTAMIGSYKSNSSSRHAKHELKDAKSHTGARSAIQDPLQNGILHKQKGVGAVRNGSSKHGYKRQYSMNEKDGFVNDTQKKRLSTDINIVDPFSSIHNPQVGLLTNNAVLNSSTNNQVSSNQLTLDFTSNNVTTTATLDGNSIDEFLSNTIQTTPITNNKKLMSTGTASAPAVVDLTTLSMDNVGETMNTEQTTVTTRSISLLQTFTPVSSSTLQEILKGKTNSTALAPNVNAPTQNITNTPAPNITITQGMIVSTGLRNSTFTIAAPQQQQQQTLGKLRTNEHIQVQPNATMSLKQVLNKDQSLLLSIPNGTKLQDNTYSMDSLDTNSPAPNITVTATTISFSGVLQGQSIQSTAANKTIPKRLTSKDNIRLFQQFLAQQKAQKNNLSDDNSQQHATVFLNNLPAQQSRTQSLHHQQQQPNVQITTPTISSSSANSQTMKSINRIHLQQISQQALQQQQQQPPQQQQLQQQSSSTQYITMQHAGYQQQILPKIPTATSQNITTFNTNPFSTNNVQTSLQFITQAATNTNALQQQSSGS